ncbi:NDMA-dependent alcohol dehydrogenase [Mycobacterium shigaense]|uniref:alcohol dehydrogenase n=1 Tax=Mycobacterium shigaense TaxID=722731 RepID=A0A1Z4EBR2_9MYCO|nr:NDMA-dependent alcohol dehydrogenase [Mycobacterium shigaense]BAX90392.1 alcohol dehydrogenase [Mycobacterium shigaense]
MKCRGAVLEGVGRDWQIREIELDPPRDGEVLVRMIVARVCHSDDHLVTGDVLPTPEVRASTGIPEPDWFPILGGHEGAGVVEEVGPGVTAVRPGDHVAMSFIPACGSCRFCVDGQSYICDAGATLFLREMPTDGTCRHHLGDENLMAYGQLGTFAEYAVLTERSVIKIDDAIPFHAASLVSCGVSTGWGSATISAGTEPGDTVVVLGTGGVGMNALQGARAAGAKHVVAVDPVEYKRNSVKIFGATHSAVSAEEAILLVADITAGVMADRVVVTAGVVHVDLIPLAMRLLRKGGTCVITGITPYTEGTVPLVLQEMVLSSKQLKGALYGGMNPRTSVPMLLSMYQAGALKLDELVTRHYRLDEINEAMADLREGRNIRGIVDFAGV